MGLGDTGRRREGPSGALASSTRPGSGPPPCVPLEASSKAAGAWTSPEEAQAAGPRLEELKRRLVRAFQRAVLRGSSRRLREEAAAREAQSRARVESALAELRAELVSDARGGLSGPPRLGPRPGPSAVGRARAPLRTGEAEGSFFPGRR